MYRSQLSESMRFRFGQLFMDSEIMKMLMIELEILPLERWCWLQRWWWWKDDDDDKDVDDYKDDDDIDDEDDKD